jgi:pyruvate,water dikinase
VGAGESLTVALPDAADRGESQVGGKAFMLGRLIAAGYRVPPGFCIPVAAYERFVAATDLSGTIRMELGRKPLASMRWEEVWDAALRIRSAFLAADVPPEVAIEIETAYERLGTPVVAVRSSAPGEDSAQRSHAGLHESLVGVSGRRQLLDAVRVVWASLWSDAALLYRQELGMDAERSRMAVVVQALVTTRPSGVGFGVDPTDREGDRQVVEAVPGLCEDLVSGAVDPDRWIIKRSSGEIVEWRAGQRGQSEAEPLLDRPDLALLHRTLGSVEELFGWVPDVEWTGKAAELMLLQARPVTGPVQRDDEREWYLTLRPGKAQLDDLCARVTEQLIPALEEEAAGLAHERLDDVSDVELAAAIESRLETLRKWEKIYWDEFIPFAHGVRQLGLYYNDAVRPEDPYEFVGLLRHQKMIASERNAALEDLASLVRRAPALRPSLERLAASETAGDRSRWPQPDDRETSVFYQTFDAFVERFMDIAYKGEALDDRPDLVLRIVLQLSATDGRVDSGDPHDAGRMEQRLLEAVGPDREREAQDVIRVGRLSWRLRDDDNILMGRLQNQLRHALDLGAARLQSQGRLNAGGPVAEVAAAAVAAALRDPGSGAVQLPPGKKKSPVAESHPEGETPRQLIGQPAAPGIYTGRARVVRSARDIGEFERGEILVCDAIQPTMTHLVPIAGGVVERRGGMLIHGAIIARELGVPCVNGVVDATAALHNGELLTVDGYLGIVTVGPPEFDMERTDDGHSAGDHK